jgi:hypothetical protein
MYRNGQFMLNSAEKGPVLQRSNVFFLLMSSNPFRSALEQTVHCFISGM